MPTDRKLESEVSIQRHCSRLPGMAPEQSAARSLFLLTSIPLARRMLGTSVAEIGRDGVGTGQCFSCSVLDAQKCRVSHHHHHQWW